MISRYAHSGRKVFSRAGWARIGLAGCLAFCIGGPVSTASAEILLAQSSERSRSGLSVKERLRRAKQREQNAAATQSQKPKYGYSERSIPPSEVKRRGSRNTLLHTVDTQRGNYSQQAKVVLYYHSNCDYCKLLKLQLDSQKIRYTAYDVTRSASARKRYEAMGGKEFPVVKIGNTILQTHDINQVLRVIKSESK